MNSKFNKKNIIPGLLPTDNNIEIFGDDKTRKAYFIRNGKIKLIDKLPQELKSKLYLLFSNDKEAWKDLGHLPFSEALNEYAFCIYGSLNNKPDVVDNEFGPGEDFKCSENCKCLKWQTKASIYDKFHFTPREREIFLLLAEGMEDRLIADKLFISTSTVGTHKQNVFRKTKVRSKKEIMKLASHL